MADDPPIINATGSCLFRSQRTPNSDKEDDCSMSAFRRTCRFFARTRIPPPPSGVSEDMEDEFEGRDDLRDRLQALGEQPVERDLAARVIQRASGRGASWWQSTKLKVAAAAAGGFLIGSVGLASAGSLPAPAQDAARSALSTVGINVPPGHDRYNDPSKCPGGPYANHG